MKERRDSDNISPLHKGTDMYGLKTALSEVIFSTVLLFLTQINMTEVSVTCIT